jgi:hypothetical protein
MDLVERRSFHCSDDIVRAQSNGYCRMALDYPLSTSSRAVVAKFSSLLAQQLILKRLRFHRPLTTNI